MRILIISNLYPPYYLGGYELRCKQICDGLVERGHVVTVLTSTHGVEGPRTDSNGTTIHRRLHLLQPFDQPNTSSLRLRKLRVGRYNYACTAETIKELKPDIVFVWSELRLTVAPYRAAQDAKVPLACSLGDTHLVGYRPVPFQITPRRIAGYLLDRTLCRKQTLAGLHFKYVQCLSNRLNAELLAAGVPLENAQVMYRGLSTKLFTPKAKVGAIGRPMKLLYVGQILPEKGISTLLESLRVLSRTWPQDTLVLSIVGSGPAHYKNSLRPLVEQCGFPVTLHGKVPYEDLPVIYRQHDVLVFPSVGSEALGVTHLEAMAAGTTVISSRGGGHDEIIVDGFNALVFEKGDDAQLAACIARIATQPRLSEQLARNALDMVLKRFSLEGYIVATERFLKRTVELTSMNGPGRLSP